MTHSKFFALLFVSLLLLSMPNKSFAKQAFSCSRDSSIVINPYPFPNPNIPRSSEVIPIAASYNSVLSSVILSFTQNLGETEVEVLNTTTGGYYSDFIDTQYLYAILPINLGPGHYIITFTLPSGQQYQGVFDI